MRLKTSVLFMLIALPAWANIVQNPGFETGDFTSWSASTTSDHPWVVAGNGPTIGTYSAQTGCVGAQCINGTIFQQAALSQLLTTVVNQNYTLSFVFTPNGLTPNELLVLFGNTIAFDLVNTPNTGAFVPYSTTVTAFSQNTALTFIARQDPGYDRLDIVNVTATGTSSTPEPSSFLLLGGLLPVAMAVRLRARKLNH